MRRSAARHACEKGAEFAFGNAHSAAPGGLDGPAAAASPIDLSNPNGGKRAPVTYAGKPEGEGET